jgi:hypothetical protein
MAITAAHVVRDYEKTHAAATWPLHLQIMNAAVNLEVIDISDDLDLATLVIDDELLSRIGKEVEPRAGRRAFRKKGVVSYLRDILPLTAFRPSRWKPDGTSSRRYASLGA